MGVRAPDRPPDEGDPADRADIERIGEEIASLAAHLHAATYRLLALLGTFDEHEGWGEGFRSCAHWLSWRTGIALGAAREKVRVARALGSLPRISEEMEAGRLSYSKARALTRVATAGNEPQLLEFALHGSASQVERLVRAWRKTDGLESERARHESRHLSMYPDEDGSWVLRGRLDPEVGALLEKALAMASEHLYGRKSQETAPVANTAQRRADAVGFLAEQALAARADVSAGTSRAPRTADRFQVVVHVDAEALAQGSLGGREDERRVEQHHERGTGQAVLAGGGQGIPAETARRLACDAGVIPVAHDGTGATLGVGRKRRTVPPSIRRALEARGPACAFPGCDNRFCDAHHVRHWADGGRTDLGNLVLLCRRHHRAVHEGGFGLRRDRLGRLRFSWPDGRPMPDEPNLLIDGRQACSGDIAAMPGRAPAVGAAVGRSGTPAFDREMLPAAPPAPGWASHFDLDWAVFVLRQ